MEDPRGTLLWEYIRMIRGIKPKAFIFENVAGLLTIDNGKVFESFLDEVCRDENGNKQYTLSHYLLNTADYGVPQFRSRLIVFGTLNGVKVSKPAPTHLPNQESQLKDLNLLATPVVGDILKGLPELPNKDIPNHIGREHSERIIERYSQLSFGERDSKTRINKLHPEKPSFTIVVGSDKGGGKGHIHPYQPREVTPRESARIQTFPDFWAFSGTSRHPIRQIGNAVPSVFAAQLASHLIKEAFNVDSTTSYEDIIETLGLSYLKTGSATDHEMVTV